METGNKLNSQCIGSPCFFFYVKVVCNSLRALSNHRSLSVSITMLYTTLSIMQLMFYAFTASVVSSKMNFSVRPCDDFYQFACGRFETTTIIPEDSGSINTINMIEGRVMSQLHTLLNSEILPGDIAPFKMAKQMFRQCMNTSESWRINHLKITLFKSSPITSSNREEWIGFCQAETECDDEVASFDGGR